jgi:hypothetical protein
MGDERLRSEYLGDPRKDEEQGYQEPPDQGLRLVNDHFVASVFLVGRIAPEPISSNVASPY